MKDLIIGVSDGYAWDKIKYWVNSINRSGFAGAKILIALNCGKETIQRLRDHGVEVVSPEIDDQGNAVYQSPIPVHVERFFHIAHVLNELREEQRPRYVITTDVRDVVFQTDPSDWLQRMVVDRHADASRPTLVAGSEGLKYKDEAWGDKNLFQTFGPYIHHTYREHTVYNVGTIAGTHEAVRDLAMMIFQMSINRPIPIVDQAVFNFLLQQNPYRATTLFTDPDASAWACQAGTLMDPTKMATFRPNLLCAEPLFDAEDKCVLTSRGQKYCIFHQYDRTRFKDEIMQKYA
jgi:hypothetical protein